MANHLAAGTITGLLLYLGLAFLPLPVMASDPLRMTSQERQQLDQTVEKHLQDETPFGDALRAFHACVSRAARIPGYQGVLAVSMPGQSCNRTSEALFQQCMDIRHDKQQTCLVIVTSTSLHADLHAREKPGEPRPARASLGAQVMEMTPDMVTSMGLSGEHNALVIMMLPNSAAAKAGLQVGDVILSFNGSELKQLEDFPRLVAASVPGSTAVLNVCRNRQSIELRATLDEAADPEASENVSTRGGTTESEPDFDADRTSLYTGPIRRPDFSSNRSAYMFRTRIREEAADGINFSGRAAVIGIGCGTDCAIVYAVDLPTGRIYNFPLGGQNTNRHPD